MMQTNPSLTRDPPRADTAQLRALKRRILDDYCRVAEDAWRQELLRHAAHEAEALAWSTPFPLLFLPDLLQEKLQAVLQYAQRQTRVWQSTNYARRFRDHQRSSPIWACPTAPVWADQAAPSQAKPVNLRKP